MEEVNCSKCYRHFPKDHFIPDKRYKRGCGSYCKECRSNAASKNPAQARKRNEYNHYKRYGLTKEDYDAMYADQGGVCAICESSEKLVIDHCHKTGNVRGLLCTLCNVMLGQARDNKKVLIAAVSYLMQADFAEK
jgi:hypothetical protein